ncbi:MAG: hypothetical protein E7624_05035 [Ruminococcaceae bacterium]|nr:hypothetical protein [Oscillospiraceae bacterium]
MPQAFFKKIFGSKKSVVLFALCLVLILATVGGTVAYLVTRTPPLDNTFHPTMVDSAPVQDGTAVSVKNLGNTSAYLRTAVVFDWVALDENDAPTNTRVPFEPQFGTDYVVTYGTANGWVKGNDGYWYYTRAVAAGGVTPPLILSFERIGEHLAHYEVSMEIITAGIQSAPESVVTSVWGVNVVNGILSPN